jgi:FkbM family methyltransferase
MIQRTPMVGLRDLGTAYGGWIVTDAIDEGWTCYCVGIGHDVSFEQALLAQGARVRSVDPVEEFVDYALETLGDEPNFAAVRAAVASSDGPIRMQKHHEPVSSSLSSAELYDSSDHLEVPGKTVSALMTAFADERVDLLKLDVEGAEYDLIPQLDLRGLGVQVFATQFHHNGSVRDAKRLIRLLADQGYRFVGCRPVVKLTFVADSLAKRTVRSPALMVAQ